MTAVTCPTCGHTTTALTADVATTAHARHNCARRRRNPPRPALPLLVAPGPWVHDAACARVDPELHYPEKGESGKEAKLVCRGCPVTTQCLEYALANNEKYGIWAGTTERDRRQIRKAAA